MFSIKDLYYEYWKQSPQELKRLLESELNTFWDDGYTKNFSTLKKCIALTEKYTNYHQKKQTTSISKPNEFLRKSGEPYINHTLRVALILVHERLFDIDVLLAAIMHDLFEDTTYSYQQAASDFNPQVADLILCVTNVSEEKKQPYDKTLTPEEIDYSSISQKCGRNLMAYYIKFADRLDNLMTLNAMPIENQLSKIEETKKYLLPLVRQFGAKRFESYIKNAIFKINESIKNDGSPNYYEAVEKRLARLWAFQSTTPTYKKLRDTFSIKSKLFKEVRLVYPSIAEIYHAVKERGVSVNSFKQEEITYELYFIANNDEAPPSLESVVETFLTSKTLQGFYISLITNDGFELRDDVNNKYIVHLISNLDFNKKLYGSSDNEITITDPWTIDDDLSSTERIAVYTPDYDKVMLLNGSTVIDFAFRIHKEIGARMTAAKVNDRLVPLHRRLKPKDKVEIITSKTSASTVDVSWLLYCATKNAKREICKLIDAKLQTMSKKMEEYERILGNNGKQKDE